MSAGRGRLPRDHPCSAGFLDETGAIATDRFFGVGLLKSAAPARLLRAVQKLRDQHHWYREIKFTSTTQGALPFYRQVVDSCLDLDLVEFFCFIADRAHADPIDRFGTPWAAYSKLAEQLVIAALRADELISVLADNYSTPDGVLFEEDLRAGVNRRLKRLAVVSVCRVDSRCCDGLQVADLLTSAIAFEFRTEAGLASPDSPRGELAAYVREKLGTDSCLAGWRNARNSVAIYDHGAWHPPAARRSLVVAASAGMLG
jgi:Protein of unknown function (DUF3800)